MEKLKILIIEDQYFLEIEKALREMLATLGLGGFFSLAVSYNEANRRIQGERFDVISLDDFLEDADSEKETIPLASSILTLNPNAVVFSLFSETISSSINKIRQTGVKHLFAKSFNFGKYEQIIHPKDIEEIKEAIIETGVVSFQKLHEDLINPVCIFSQDYADSMPSEKMAQEACDHIANKLNRRKIPYSAVVHGFHLDLSVEAKNLMAVKAVASESGLRFWIEWVQLHLR